MLRFFLAAAVIFAGAAIGPSQQTHKTNPDAPEPTSTAASQSTDQRSPPATGFLFSTTELKGRTHAYCVYIPPEYTPDKAWPVVLFLHGSRAAGTDGFLQTDNGIAKAIRRKRALCPAIVVMPQAPRGQWWAGDALLMALRCVEETSLRYHCDSNRVYLTGLSMGGAGTWLLGSQMPDVFAALIPISGFLEQPRLPPSPAELERAAANLVRVPIWCFHGSADHNVSVERSRELVAAVQAAGGTIKYTEYPEGGHDIWERVYANPAVWRWLLAQKREAHGAAPHSQGEP